MDFKYTSTFEVKASLRKRDFAKGSFVSKASLGLDELSSLLPDASEIQNNPDLLYTCFNAAVANLINLNGDGITTKGAKKLVETCKLKPMNIEHFRSDIVGVITNYGFSSFGDNKILTPDELTDDPFNISLAAIVWKLSNREFADFIKSSQDEDDMSFAEVSTSWEVGFNSYKLAVGSKDLRKAKIVEKEDEIESLSKYLHSMGGSGFTPDGEEVYRVIDDECRFLGCAFTTNPAAAVKGVKSVDFQSIGAEISIEIEDEEEEDKEDDSEEMDKEEVNKEDSECKCEKKDCAKCKDKEHADAKILNKNTEQISPKKKTRVIKYMKYKNIDELVDHLHEAAASDVREFIVSQIQLANDKFVNLQSEKEVKDKELADALANLKSFEDQSKALSDQISQLKATIKQQEDETKFTERMESLTEQFDIDQAAAKTISKSILGLSDESFAQWLEDFKPLLKTKTPSKELEIKASVNPVIPNSQDANDKKANEWKQTLSKIEVKIK